MSNRKEIEQLLPWYVTGKLDADDQRQVEAYLAEHRDLDDQLSVVRDDHDAVISMNENIATPSSEGFDRLLAKIDASEPAQPSSSPGSFIEAVRDLFGVYGSPTLKLAAGAVAVVFVAQTIAITALLTGGSEKAPYETAFVSEEGQTPDLLISFTSDTTVTEIEAVLAEIDGVIVGGPKPGGTFEISLRAEPKSDEHVQQVIAKLRARTDLVREVLQSE